MVESISTIRQMMAEGKFLEAQRAAEALLILNEISSRNEILPLYLEILLTQEKHLPTDLLIETAELLIKSDIEQTQKWLSCIPATIARKYFRKIYSLKLQIAEAKGLTQSLYELLTQYQLELYNNRIPALPSEVELLVEKYFKKDFHLNLQRLAITILAGDSANAKKMIQDLLLTLVEKSSAKRTHEKYLALYEVLSLYKGKGALILYRNFCLLASTGIKEKSDYKKLVEIVIFFEDIKLQAQLLHFIDSWDLSEVATDYATCLRTHSQYDFVYFSKYFPHLKKYFFKPMDKIIPIQEAAQIMDLTLEPQAARVESEKTIPNDEVPEEVKLIHFLKYHDYTCPELLELAVSFLQSEMPKVALQASSLAKERALDDSTFLKACYLKLNCQLLLSDYRAALDLTFEALERSRTEDEILSFLYGQAEALLQLKKTADAQTVLKKIISIDADYRMAKERLERLNEI